nr:TPM domain-containing protein [Xenococcus sp. PCC 7305]
MSLIIMLFASFCLANPAIATGLYELPNNPMAKDIWVVDLANEISLATQGSLSSDFKDLAKATGQEIRMVAIRRLDYGETINTLADKLFANWYPSEEDKSNQTLLVMDTLTNTAALRTGDAARMLVKPEIAESLVEETVGYDLRNGNKYNQAFLDASDRLMAVLSGEADPGPPAIEKTIQVASTFSSAEETDDGIAFTWVIVLLILATVIPMVTYFLYVM